MRPFDQIDILERAGSLDFLARRLDVLSHTVSRQRRLRSVLAGEPFGHSAHPMLVQRRQELLRPRLPSRPRRARDLTAAPSPQGRTGAARWPILQAATADRRVELRHPQRAARP